MTNTMREYYFKFLYKYLYEGNYYKLKSSKKIIDNSHYTENKKKKLKEFLKDVEKNGLYYLVNIPRNKYYPNKINNRINDLNKLNINPIPIPADIPIRKLHSLYKLLPKTAIKKYFK